MIQRCGNARNPGFANYGGRGITVCERWLSFENFLADMGPRPTPAHSIDRIDNDRGYEPGNCRWATVTEQNRNRRSTKLNEVAAALIRHMMRRGGRGQDVAHAFGVSRSLVQAIACGKAWA